MVGKNPRRLLAPILLLVFFGLFIFLWRRQSHFLGPRLQENPFLLISCIAAWFGWINGFWLINAFRTQLLLKSKSLKISFREAYALTAATAVLNFLPLQGGIAARGIYLKRRFNMPVSDYFSMTVATYIILLIGENLLGLAFCLSEWPQRKMLLPLAVFSGLLVFGSLFCLIQLPWSWQTRLAESPHRWVVWLLRVYQSFRGVFRDKLILWALLGLEVLFFFVEAGKIRAAFYLMGLSKDIPFSAFGLMSAVSTQSIFFNLTPSGLGVREMLIAAVARYYDFRLQDAFLAASLDRVLMLIPIFSIGGLYAWKLMHLARQGGKK